MNYLHSSYLKSGKITNDNLLYTLSLFALEPARWVSRYEWRALTDLELAACGTYWKALGDAMDINYAALASHKAGWRDGLHWLNEVEDWSIAYEDAKMKPAPSNQKLADSHFDILCYNVPLILLGPCKKVMSVLLGPKLRDAMR